MIIPRDPATNTRGDLLVAGSWPLSGHEPAAVVVIRRGAGGSWCWAETLSEHPLIDGGVRAHFLGG